MSYEKPWKGFSGGAAWSDFYFGKLSLATEWRVDWEEETGVEVRVQVRGFISPATRAHSLTSSLQKLLLSTYSVPGLVLCPSREITKLFLCWDSGSQEHKQLSCFAKANLLHKKKDRHVLCVGALNRISHHF